MRPFTVDGKKPLEGSITVFLALLVLPAAAFFLVLVHLAFVHVERNAALGMTQTAGESVRNSYIGSLAERYGLYATDRSKLNSRCRGFLAYNETLPMNRIRQTPVYILFPERLDEGPWNFQTILVDTEVLHSLNEPARLQDQINIFMEYRLAAKAAEWLIESISQLTGAAKGSGLEALYEDMLEALQDYEEAYGDLVGYLYAGNDGVYVTMTKMDAFEPEKLYHAVRCLYEQTGQEEDLIPCVTWSWLIPLRLSECNRNASAAAGRTAECAEVLANVINEIERYIAEQPEEIQSGERVAEIRRQIAEIRDKLWGMNGEAAVLRRDLEHNAEIVAALPDVLNAAMKECKEGELSVATYLAAEEAANRFLGYVDDIDLSHEAGEGKKLRLGSIWKWLKGLHVDLSRYGENRTLLAGETFVIPNDEKQAAQYALEHAEEMAERGAGVWILDKFFLMEYAMGMFTNMMDQVRGEKGGIRTNLLGEPFREGLFRNEMEYILCGSGNELSNLRMIQWEIIGIRMMFNMAHLVADSVKRNAILSFAQGTLGMILPGIGTAIAYGAVTFLWATAESYVDFQMLAQGKKVPLLKTRETWQTDLDKLMAKNKAGLGGTQENEEGLTYEMYLRLLFILGNTEAQRARIQLLIEKNMQKSGWQSFTLYDAVTEFRLKTSIMGRGGEYESQGVFAYD